MKIRPLVIAAIVAICIGAPIAEMFDRWDQTAQDGNDTEANVVVAALCIGVAFAVGTVIVIARIRALAWASPSRLLASRPIRITAGPCLSPSPAASPPHPLRI